MAEDEAAPDHLIKAIERVDKLSWPKVRHHALCRALNLIADMLHYDIVRIEPPVASAGSDSISPPTKEK